MARGFPRALGSTNTGEAGINAVARIVNDQLRWIFRRVHQEHDYGIDAFLDIVHRDGFLTGKSIAVQIKSGTSYFAAESTTSFSYYGDMKHFNYYANMDVPVLLIIYDARRDIAFWERFDPSRTEKLASGWKLSIPKSNKLSSSTVETLTALTPPVVDAASVMDKEWRINSEILEADLLYYVVGREDVEAKRVSLVRKFIRRLEINETLERHSQGKVSILIDGYNNDPRELFEIREVKIWFKLLETEKIPWFYYSETKLGSFILLMFASLCGPANILSRENGKVGFNFSPKRAAQLLRRQFILLNEKTSRLKMPIEDNKAISQAVAQTIMPKNMD